MAPSGQQLMNALRDRQRRVSRRLGCVLQMMPAEPRVVLQLSNIGLVAVAQLLIDKGVFTAAELQAYVDASAQWSYTQESPMPEPPPRADEIDPP